MKDAFIYYVAKWPLYFFSLLPMWLLSWLSFILAFVLSRVLHYRKQVILKNLKNSFPEITKNERNSLIKNYYVHLADMVVEGVKALTISPKKLKKFIHFNDLALFDKYFYTNRNIITVMAHTGNWEWAGLCMGIDGKNALNSVYRPLSNPYFDRLFLRLRQRFGGEMTPMQSIARAIHNTQKPTCFNFIADQTATPEHAIWLKFLNQDTPFFFGYEKLALRYKMPIVIIHVRKTKKHRYIIYLEEIYDGQSAFKEGEIVRKYAKLLEQEIQHKKTYWLWSHKRWKHTRPKV